MPGFWQRYQQLIQGAVQRLSSRYLQLCALLCLFGCVLLFLRPERSEWLLVPLLLMLWSLLLLLAKQMFSQPPSAAAGAGLLSRLGYWLRWGWYQLLLLLFLGLCLVSLAFSLKLAGVILRALLA